MGFFITTAIDYPNSRPHIGTAFEKIGADVQARFRRMEGDPRPLPDGQRREHHQGRAGRRETRARAQALRRRHGPPVPGSLGGARDLQRRLHPDVRGLGTTSAARSSSRRFTTRAISIRSRIPASTATAARRSRPRRRSSTAGARTTRTANSATSRRRITSSSSPASPTVSSRTTRPTPTSSSPRAAATRSSASSNRACSTSRSPGRVHLGHPRPVRPRADHLRLVRRLAQLHHGHRLRHG